MKKYFFACSVCLFFVLTFGFGIPAHADAPAPFSDSFDTYSPGNVYAQGQWQNKANVWNVTTQGCYGGTGKCIASTGLNDTTTWKSGTPLTTGAWRVRFKVNSPLNGGYFSISFAADAASLPAARQPFFAITDDGGSTQFSAVQDIFGNYLASGLANKTWHTLVYKWDMSDPAHCTFKINVDNTTDVPVNPLGNASTCYHDTFPNYTISTLALNTYYQTYTFNDGRVELDDIGDGPTLDGCTANCDGKTPTIITDTFDHFNDKGWAPLVSPVSSATFPFSFDDGSTGNCHQGACITLTGSLGGIYLESGVASTTGAFVLWMRGHSPNPTTAPYAAQGRLGLCATAWSNCFIPLTARLPLTVQDDDLWHQYFISWRAGTSTAQVCVLRDDTDATHCAWSNTTFPLGTPFDGVSLEGAAGSGGQLWVDDLTVPPPTTALTLSGTQGLNGWYTSAVTATLTPTDGSGGPFTTYYSLDGAATTTSVGSNTLVPVTSDGVHTLTFYSVDTATGGTEILQSKTFKIDTVAPTTSVSLVGTAGLHGWYTSAVTATLAAFDALSGVTTTYYSLDGAATTTLVGQVGASIPVTAEGIHTLSYYSVDAAGNSETPTSTSIKIDETSPEVSMSASTSTQDLSIVGIDNISSTTVTKIGDVVTVADQAGNTTTLNFCKTYSGKVLTFAHLTSIQYGSAAPISLPTSFLFVWNVFQTPPPLVSQTVVVDPVYGIEALFNKSKNQTTVALLQRNQKIQTSTVSGLAIVKLTTNKGTIQYSW